jgi:hypothetical protein
MTLLGHIENGVIVLDEAMTLPDGMKVRVEVLPVSKVQVEDDASPTLYEQLLPVVGTLQGLPPDLARNHDHYIHGQAKK